MNEIKIRKAELADLPILLELEQQLIETERQFDRNMKEKNASYYNIEELMIQNESVILVAESNLQIVGSGYAKIKKSEFHLKEDFHSYLGFMYVDPNFRRQGINSLIIEGLIDWSKKKHIKVVRLEVLEGNESAIKAYQNLGFENYLREMRLNLENNNLS